MMEEFSKKKIEFQVIKLDDNCDQMIEVMKSCHDSLEVTDISTTNAKSEQEMDGQRRLVFKN